MIEENTIHEDGEVTYGQILAPLWAELISTAGHGAEVQQFPPAPVDVEVAADRAIKAKSLNGSTAEFKKLVELARHSRWLTVSEFRFVVGTALAYGLAKQVVGKCSLESGSQCNQSELAMKSVVESIPEVDRPSVLGAMLLAPETDFRTVDLIFSDNESMVSSLFIMPLEAARLRIAYDQAIDGNSESP